MRAITKNKRGFTLVELMIVVAIVGVLAALAIYGVRRYILNAKTAEARNSIGQMAKDASSAYNREGMSGVVLTVGSSTGVTNHLCGPVPGSPNGGAPVPAAATSIQGKKYQSAPTEWQTGDQNNGWVCLRFSMQDPQYYQYNYTATGITGGVGDTFDAMAQGDLDADGTLSTFELKGLIQGDSAGGNLVVTIAPNITENNPDE